MRSIGWREGGPVFNSGRMQLRCSVAVCDFTFPGFGIDYGRGSLHCFGEFVLRTVSYPMLSCRDLSLRACFLTDTLGNIFDG